MEWRSEIETHVDPRFRRRGVPNFTVSLLVKNGVNQTIIITKIIHKHYERGYHLYVHFKGIHLGHTVGLTLIKPKYVQSLP